MEQISIHSLPGEYYLKSVPEMASGFKLNTDRLFEFFLIYGALDRYGNGTWNIIEDQIIFNSSKWIGRDFQLPESQSVDYDKIVIEITECNPALMPYIFGNLEDGMQESWKHANKDGKIFFELQQFSSISLAFEFCPERFSKFVSVNNNHNHFKCKPEPWLFECFFNNFVLDFKEDGLFGKHPMIADKDFYYSKHK